MRLSRNHLILATFSLFSACSVREPASIERGPASDSAPIGPERNRNARRGRDPGGAPIGPERDDNGHGGAASSDRGNEEMRKGCGVASLLRINMGNGFSAHDILVRIQSEGTFSGRARIPTWRSVPQNGGANGWMVDYASSVEFDRSTLAPWFNGGSPSAKGSDIYEAVRDSEPFNYAVQFVNANGPLRVYRDQYDIGHRMASLLAVMFAASEQGDPDCVEYINRDWVSKILPSKDAQKLMNQIRSKEASQLVKEGRIEKVFGEVAANRQRIHDDLEQVDKDIANKEEQNKAALNEIQYQLRDSYHALKSEMMEIGPCRDYVSLQEKLNASSTDPKTFANKLVDDCKTRLDSTLQSLRSEQLRIQAEIKINEERRKAAEEARRVAEERGGREAEVARRTAVIAKYDEKIESLRIKNEATSERAQKFSDYLNLLVKSETSSALMELKRINDLLADRERRITTEYLKPELQKIERLKGDLKANSTHYLTLGFFGGFEGSTGSDFSR